MGNCCCPRARQERDVERKKQENSERDEAALLAKRLVERPEFRDKYNFELDDTNTDGVPIPRNIGGRLQKYWFILREKSSSSSSGRTKDLARAPAESEITLAEVSSSLPSTAAKAYLSVSPVPSGCPLDLGDAEVVKKFNSILEKLRQHPFIHPVLGMEYLMEENKVAIIQKFHTDSGSLRDVIFGEKPYRPKKKFFESIVQSWSKKYKKPKEEVFDSKKIARFGRQILSAMAYLHDTGFQALGHVHSGNIFISVDTTGSTEEEVCMLGGHEQTLLGYRAMLYREIVKKGLLKYIDTIMFGHVIYEMATGMALPSVLPSDADYREVDNEEVQKVLRVIFNTTTKLNISKLLKNEFFRDQDNSVQRRLNEFTKIKPSSGEKALLSSAAQLYAVQESDTRSRFQKLFGRNSSNTALRQPLLQAADAH